MMRVSLAYTVVILQGPLSTPQAENVSFRRSPADGGQRMKVGRITSLRGLGRVGSDFLKSEREDSWGFHQASSLL